MNMKELLKVTLLLQLLAYTLATYGHPDAEVFSLPNQPSRDELIVEAAIKRGMDGEAVAELLRTQQPVVRTTTTPGGFTKTTTYKLEPDGSISSKSILQKRNRYVYNTPSIPDELKNAPMGTVTRTFTDSNGNKVTQTISVNQQKHSPPTTTDDLSDDWFSKSFSTWHDERPSVSPSLNTAHKTLTKTYTSPTEERRTIEAWSSDPPAIYMPHGGSTSTRTRTYIKPEDKKHVVQTKSNTNGDTSWSEFPTMDDSKFPSIDYLPFSHPWNNLDPDNTDGWQVWKEPESTTKKKFESWDWPYHTTSTTAKNQLHLEPATTTTRKPPLPNLEEFLKSQYGRNSNREPITPTITTASYTPKSLAANTAQISTSTPKVINIDDLPVVEVLHNGKPASEGFLKTLPPHLTPRTPAKHVLSIENKHPIEEQFDENVAEHTPKVETNIRTYSKTHIGSEKPTLKDLDPQMQDILRNAGIVPEIEGDSITKTRTEPDGRVITTSYKVHTMPLPHAALPSASTPPQIKYTHSIDSNQYLPSLSSPSTMGTLSPIAEFLAKLGLTKYDITSTNGRYTKTILDENGDALTATFVLTSL